MQIVRVLKNKNADGLRGIACLSVVLHHFIAAFLPFLLHKDYPTVFAAQEQSSLFVEFFSSPVMTLFYSGHFAVVIFFVLSGYVLAAPYYTRDDASLVLQKRLWGRYLRLNIPVAASIALSLLLYSCRKYYNLPASALSGSQWLAHYFPPCLSYVTGIQDMLWKSLVLGDATFNTTLWTLKTEFIGSVCLLLFYILKPKKKTLLPWIFFLLLLYFCYQKNFIFLFAIMMGSLLNAVTIPKRCFPLLVLGGLYLGAFQFENQLYDFLPIVGPWKKKDFYATIGAILLVAPIVQGYGRKLFESRLFQFLGTISFSLYLLHFLVLCSFSCALYLFLHHTFLALLFNFFLYLLIAVFFAILFERYIDKPAIALAHRVANFLLNLKSK
ncbi:MAG: acyltransferase family protein [Chthoniobacterales bacterium]